VARDFSALRPTPDSLARLSGRIGDAILAGLVQPDREIKALPAFLRRPATGLSGRAVVLDVGGTHMRAAWIELGDGRAELLGPIRENELMRQATSHELGADEFFDAQAALVAAACPERDIVLGYCFSYPATITPEGEAVLIEWTKGIRIRDVAGRSVGALLRDALRRRGRTALRVPVLNDTVASLLAAAILAPRWDRHAAAIVATGTNMAGFYPAGAIAKLDAATRRRWPDDELMAVNLESGAFDPGDILTRWDEALDRASPPGQRGRQRFEKAVSGAYLPRLLYEVAGAAACAQAGFDPADPAVDAGDVARARDDPRLGKAAGLLIDRSADLVAAGLAALLRSYDAVGVSTPRTAILVEGNLFHLTPGYAARVASRLGELAPRAEATFIATDGQAVPANMLGAASAALAR
jgi:hexokinase